MNLNLLSQSAHGPEGSSRIKRANHAGRQLALRETKPQLGAGENIKPLLLAGGYKASPPGTSDIMPQLGANKPQLGLERILSLYS